MAKLVTTITVPLVVTMKSDTSVNVWELMNWFNKRIKLQWDNPAEYPPGGTMVGLWAEWEHPTVTVEEERIMQPEPELPDWVKRYEASKKPPNDPTTP